MAQAAAGYDRDIDGPRLATQLERLELCMRDQQWRTLREISEQTEIPEASASAGLRKLRATGRRVDRERLGPKRGTWRYRVLPQEPSPQMRLY